MKCAIGKLGVSKIECLHLHRWSRNGPRCGCSVLGLLDPSEQGGSDVLPRLVAVVVIAACCG